MTPNSAFQNLRDTATNILSAQKDMQASERTSIVRVDHEAVGRLAAQFSLSEIRDKVARVGLPLKFPRPLDELNFHAMLSLLSFGGAYEGDSICQSGHLRESARDTVLFGLIGLHLSKTDLRAGFLMTVTRSDVASYFGIEPMENVPHDSMPAIRVERPGPLSRLVDELVTSMNTVGARLKELGEPDLAHFILAAMRGEEVPTVARLVTALDAAFPSTFGAPLPCPGSRTETGFHCRKKSLMLAGELYHRLRHSFAEFDFQDFSRAPGYATPALITFLVSRGVLCPMEDDGGDEQAHAAAVARLLENPDNVAPLTAGTMVAMDELAVRMAEAATEGEVEGSHASSTEKAVVPLDLSYFLDEMWSKQESERRRRQTEPAGNGEQSCAATEPATGPLHAEMAPAGPSFVPPRGQTVM